MRAGAGANAGRRAGVGVAPALGEYIDFEQSAIQRPGMWRQNILPIRSQILPLRTIHRVLLGGPYNAESHISGRKSASLSSRSSWPRE